jgi:putative nucleotidyltransferase with HDIG domain
MRERRARLTHRILVDLLLNALTADDPATARHSRRVADLGYALAQACGMKSGELATLRVAALLHDMGKIDDRFWHIVHSRQPLSRRQRDEIKYHPHESARILEPLEQIHPGISAIVASHHECWNGDGYPRGLEKEEIPLGARIIAVADAFDAITQPRKYRDALPVEEALDELCQGSGRQFDPRLIEHLQCWPVLDQWSEIARNGLVEEQRARTQDREEEKEEARAHAARSS